MNGLTSNPSPNISGIGLRIPYPPPGISAATLGTGRGEAVKLIAGVAGCSSAGFATGVLAGISFATEAAFAEGVFAAGVFTTFVEEALAKSSEELEVLLVPFVLSVP